MQFGVPIAMHQAIQFMIADMATEIEASRLLTWKSAVMLDNGERNTLVSSHAKRFAADTAMKVATEAVQVYGGYGFIKEYPVEKLFRDAKIMQLYEGTSQIQRLVDRARNAAAPPRRGADGGPRLMPSCIAADRKADQEDRSWPCRMRHGRRPDAALHAGVHALPTGGACAAGTALTRPPDAAENRHRNKRRPSTCSFSRPPS